MIVVKTLGNDLGKHLGFTKCILKFEKLFGDPAKKFEKGLLFLEIFNIDFQYYTMGPLSFFLVSFFQAPFLS